MKGWVELGILLAALAIVAGCPTRPPLAKPSNVADLRVDIVEHALDQAERSAGSRSEPTPAASVAPNSSDDSEQLRRSLKDARSSIVKARTATDAWARGDEGPWKTAAPNLESALAEVRAALLARNLPVPPGLTEGLTAKTPCCRAPAGPGR